ncbi:hypothetical protein ACE6H2_025790 [Prunus campanulata]
MPQPNMGLGAMAMGSIQVPRVHMPPPLPDFRLQTTRRNFATNGCPYGESCRFAHREAEWQKHPQHKTKRCKYFHCATGCRFGDRCHFMHDGPGHL